MLSEALRVTQDRQIISEKINLVWHRRPTTRNLNRKGREVTFFFFSANYKTYIDKDKTQHNGYDDETRIP